MHPAPLRASFSCNPTVTDQIGDGFRKHLSMSSRTSIERSQGRNATSTASTAAGISLIMVVELLITAAVRKLEQRPRKVVSGRSAYVLHPSPWRLRVNFRITTLGSDSSLESDEASKLSPAQRRQFECWVAPESDLPAKTSLTDENRWKRLL